jgi:hypothetical protein
MIELSPRRWGERAGADKREVETGAAVHLEPLIIAWINFVSVFDKINPDLTTINFSMT